jgi:hypothetical protein
MGSNFILLLDFQDGISPLRKEGRKCERIDQPKWAKLRMYEFRSDTVAKRKRRGGMIAFQDGQAVSRPFEEESIMTMRSRHFVVCAILGYNIRTLIKSWLNYPFLES